MEKHIENGVGLIKSLHHRKTNRMTVEEWLTQWMNVFCHNNIRASTYVSYEIGIKNYIVPYIGNIYLRSIRGVHVQQVYNALIQKGLSPKTVRNVYAIMHRAFSIAIKQGYIFTNPCDSAELPKISKHEINPLNTKEVSEFLLRIETSPYRNAYALCLFTGIREGECLGLSWSQIDLDSGKIVISQQLQKNRVNGQHIIIPTTKSGKPRVFKVPKIALQYLLDEQAKQIENQKRAGALWNNPNNLVFTNEIGNHYSYILFISDIKRLSVKLVEVMLDCMI